jgi:hypothetical protein
MAVDRRETNRGFALWQILNSQYPGDEPKIVTVQESSLATEAKVWVGYEGDERMHLSAQPARDLRDALSAWLEEVGESGS